MQRLEVPVPRPRRDGVVRSLVVDVAIPRLLLVSRAIVVPELIRPSHGGAWLIPSPRRRSNSDSPFAVLLLFVLVRELVLLLVVFLQGIVLDHRHRPGLGEKLGSDRDDQVVAVLVLVVVVALLLLRLGLLERDVGELEDGAAFFFGAGALGERGFGRCGSLQRGDGLDHGHAWRDGGRRGDGGNHRRGLRHPEPHRGGRRDGGNDDGRRWGLVVAPATQRIIVILLIVVVVVHAPAHRHRQPFLPAAYWLSSPTLDLRMPRRVPRERWAPAPADPRRPHRSRRRPRTRRTCRSPGSPPAAADRAFSVRACVTLKLAWLFENQQKTIERQMRVRRRSSFCDWDTVCDSETQLYCPT